jgi:nitrite reductase/ring-hydroxylating ferredoxin subunit
MIRSDMSDAEYVPAADLDELEREGRVLVNRGGHAIALFHDEGEVRAVDNRCPHMGFPLTEGTVDDGILTCHWHHARFELGCGDTFDPWADDVPTYPVEVRDGEVYVRPEPQRDKPPAEHWRDRLDVGLRENLGLVLAKATIGLADAGVDYVDPFDRGLAFGTEYRAEGWGSGLTIHTALANVRPMLDEDDRRRAMYVGLSEVASDASGSAPWFDQPALQNEGAGPERLTEWFRDNVEVRDADGAERVLRTAAERCDEATVAEMLLAAATDHRYLDTGHTLDHVNKSFEALDHVGWDRAPDVLTRHASNLAGADRAEESSEWRQPVDLAGLLDDTFEDLPDHAAAGADEEWSEPDDFVDRLLDDDPHAVVETLVEAVRSGATPADLAGAVTAAAARRVAQFSTANEFSDWNTVHHTYTYANAVHGLTRRTDAWEGYRGAFDAAVNVFLDRFLNMPAAPVPEGDPDADPDEALAALDETFEREGAVNEASECAADFLAGGGDPERLMARLGHVLLREDSGFHTIQNVEVGVQQARRATDPDRRRVFLVAAARYLGAHTPTRREREQTYTIAARLNRGEAVHEASADD